MDFSRMMPKPEDILKYIVLEKDYEEEVIRATGPNLENILHEHDNLKAEISRDDKNANEELEMVLEQVMQQQKKIAVVYYEPTPLDEENIYVVEDEGDFDYLFVPRGITVNRVSQNILGPNVLGRTWLGSGYIEILDTLIGDSFQEVLLHELNHLLYPHENEQEIRARTRRQLTNPIYH